MKIKLAIIGTNGIPSKYGGFETLVEFLVLNLAVQYDITVFCSTKLNKERLPTYNGVKLEYIKLNANGWQSIFYDMVSIFRSYKKYDKILVLGCSGSLIMPLFKKYIPKFIMNLGGLDWQRSKWNWFTRKYLKWSEEVGVKYAGQIISDNMGIREYLLQEYGLDSRIVTYGGDQAKKIVPEEIDLVKYPFLRSAYAFTVARIQHDNNIDMLLESFDENSLMPFVFVGNWKNSEYGIRTKEKFINRSNLILLDAIYDQRELNVLRSNCKIYLHGHSAGGTNPALVEAMNLGLAILSFHSLFNKYTTHNEALYFKDSTDLKFMLNSLTDEQLKSIGENMLRIGKQEYSWKKISEEYAAVIEL